MAARFVKEVLAHAIEHYEEGGWDYVVECWTEKEIEDATKDCRTVEGAIKVVGKRVGICDSYRKEIQAEIF